MVHAVIKHAKDRSGRSRQPGVARLGRGIWFESTLEGNHGPVMLDGRPSKRIGARIGEHRRFLDRVEAGERLAVALVGRVRKPTIVLGIHESAVRSEVERQTREVARRTAAYRVGRPPLELDGRTAVLVDDGIATG